MKRTLIILLFLIVPNFINADANMPKIIKNIVETNLLYTQTENMNGLLSTMHSKSNAYAETKQMAQVLFMQYDLKYTLINYYYVGEDNEYAYAKVKVKTEKIHGPSFSNNIIEGLQVFKQEQGVWKLWNQLNLSVDFY